jgi:hypothetical protein
MRYALTFLMMATVALGQGVWPKTATVVDGGHRYDFDTLGKRSVTPSADYGNIVLWQAFSYSDNSDADFYDLSTSGNDGSQTTAASQPTWSSADGGVYDFDGVDDSIDLPSFTGISASFTVAAWIRSDLFSGVITVLDSRNDTAPNDGFYFGFIGSKVWNIVDAGASAGNTQSTTSLSTNQWYHIASTWAGGNILVYVNGADDNGSPTSLAGTLSITDAAAVGVNTSSGTDFFDGDLDDVRIYSTALTAAQIGAIYTNTAPTYGISP